MDDDRFWTIVEQCHSASGGDMVRKDREIETAIRSLSSDDALAFYQIFRRMMTTAYTWPLWGAAYVIHGGCSDNTFSDFRASLISRGRTVFEKAISDPDSLADEEIDQNDEDDWFHAGYDYAVLDAVTATIGKRPASLTPLPPEPSGQPWDEATVDALYPRLARNLASRDHA